MTTNNLTAKIYSQDGKSSGTINLPETIFSKKWNADLVHQVITSMQSNLRSGTANAKGRGEVRGGGKKPWKQKGTGRARHGSTRSPIWIGGGVTHGPLAEKVYTKKVNKKMKMAALSVLLSSRLHKDEMLFVDSIKIKDGKTKNAATVVSALSKITGFDHLLRSKKNTALFLIPEYDVSLIRAFKNLPQIEIKSILEISPLDVALSRYVVVLEPEKSMEKLSARKNPVSLKEKTK